MPTPKTTSKDIYQIKVTLLGSKPPIWRRVQVPADVSLLTLHNIVQNAMGWENGHLHQFIIGGTYYGDEMLLDEGDVEDEAKFKLNKVVKRPKEKFIYEYDFGDGWEHQLEVEKILPAEPDVRYPRCVAGKRACPPEDCGGVWGYASLLEAIGDPDHPEHEDMSEWVGDDFDPEKFDLDGVNKILRGYSK